MILCVLGYILRSNRDVRSILLILWSSSSESLPECVQSASQLCTIGVVISNKESIRAMGNDEIGDVHLVKRGVEESRPASIPRDAFGELVSVMW